MPALALAATPSWSNDSGVLIRGYRAPRSTPGYYLAALRAALDSVPISDYLMRQVYYCPFKAGISEDQRHRRVATAETFTQSSLTRRDLFAVTIPALKGRAKFSRRSATKPSPLSIRWWTDRLLQQSRQPGRLRSSLTRSLSLPVLTPLRRGKTTCLEC